MSTVNTNDLQAFLVVAQEQSFTRAAVRLGVAPSALSHSMRLLEERLGIRLLARTTRNVSPTQAGERLMHSIAPHFEAIVASIDALGDLRDRPAGTLRIDMPVFYGKRFVMPLLAALQDLGDWPEGVQVQLGEQRQDALLGRPDPLPANLDHITRGKPVIERASAHPWIGLQHLDPLAGLRQPPGRSQPGDPRPHHYHIVHGCPSCCYATEGT